MKWLVCCLLILNEGSCLYGQTIPVEIMAGTQRTGADLLWFRKFQQKKGSQSPWLFFHRSRASVDYKNRVAFGMTNALSYNFRNGVGLVLATQFLQTGFVYKAGAQYFHSFPNGSLFTWLVAGENSLGNFSGDWFLLARWMPRLDQQHKWFFQAENLYQLDSEKNLSIVHRLRAGWGNSCWQYGLAADLTAQGKSKPGLSVNPGLFMRKEF